MPEIIWPSVRGRRLRATKVDGCGRPVAGPCSTVVTDGFISIAYSNEIAEGEEIEQRKADGTLCVSSKGCPELKWIGVEIQLCGVDPDLITLLTGYETVLNYAGEGVGNRISSKVQCDGGVALEVWSDVPGVVCGETGAQQYGYFLIPWLQNGILTEWTIENAAATFTLTGQSAKGSGWGVGPYDVDAQDAANTPGPLLTPIGPDDHLDLHVTTIPPPDPSGGCQELVLPPGP